MLAAKLNAERCLPSNIRIVFVTHESALRKVANEMEAKQLQQRISIWHLKLNFFLFSINFYYFLSTKFLFLHSCELISTINFKCLDITT